MKTSVLDEMEDTWDQALISEALFQGLVNPSLLFLLESRMLFKLKEEVALRNEFDKSFKTMYLSDIQFIEA